jgi:hypothetical protein
VEGVEEHLSADSLGIRGNNVALNGCGIDAILPQTILAGLETLDCATGGRFDALFGL